MIDRNDGLDRMRSAADQLGIAVDVVKRPVADSLGEAASLLGLQPEDIVKSLVVKRHDGGFLFALIPGDRQIAWPGLRAAVGVNKLQMPPADEALAATGYERGTITPIGAAGSWPVFADVSIVGRRIALGAGAHGYSAFVDADALIAAYAATVAEIAT